MFDQDAGDKTKAKVNRKRGPEVVDVNSDDDDANGDDDGVDKAVRQMRAARGYVSIDLCFGAVLMTSSRHRT